MNIHEQTPSQENPEKELEQRLLQLVGREVAGVEVGSHGAEVVLKFKDGATLSFFSWDALDDKPDTEGIKVTIPKEE